MPMFGTPIAASRREPSRAVRLPEGVKRAVLLMIEEGLDFISAAKQVGLQPQAMRRWLGRAECIKFLRNERSRFRQSVCAQNEAVLAQIRDDRDGNQMARVHAVRALERLDEHETMRRPDDMQSRGITLRIVHQTLQPAPIDITPRSPQIIDGS